MYALAVTDSDVVSSPDVQKIVPGIPFAVNPKYLMDALSGMGNMAIIRVYAANQPIVIESNYRNRVALIMPMYASEEYLAPHPIVLGELPKEIQREEQKENA